VVALVITAGVYGVVAAIVKMDDVGLRLAHHRGARFVRRLGRLLVVGMPKLLAALSVIGTVAMLWVGGHILLVGTDTLGWHGPYGLMHHASEAVRHATGPAGPVLAWLVDTGISAVVGLVVGSLVVGLLRVLPRPRRAARRHT